MLRHRCAACGRHINRLDQFFEDSDGTLCRVCVSRLAQPLARPAAAPPCPAAPTWGQLPMLSMKHPVR